MQTFHQILRGESLQARPSTRVLMFAILIMVLVRGAAFVMTPTAFQADPDAYKAIAKTIDQFGVVGLTGPDGTPRAIAFRPPLYPWLLSWCVVDGRVSNVAVGVFHLLSSALTAGFAFSATRRFVGLVGPPNEDQQRDRLGLIAVGLIAVDPILLRQSTEVMTETLAAMLTTMVIWLWSRWHPDGHAIDKTSEPLSRTQSIGVPVGLGILLATAYLCRPTFLVWAVLLIGAIFIQRRNQRGVMSGILATAIVLATVAGWTARNRRAIGHPVWATTHGGYTLLLANNESFYAYLYDGPFGHAWDATSFMNAYQHRYEGDPREASFWAKEWSGKPNYDAAVSEYDDDRLCYQAAVATINRHPGMFLWSSLVRVARLWSPFPHDVTGRSLLAVILVGAFYIAFAIAVFVAVVRHRRTIFGQQWLAVWLLLTTLTCVHAVYWSNLRMRAPAMPALAMIAVLCVLRDQRSVNQSTPNSKTLR